MKSQTAAFLGVFGILIALLGVIHYQTHPENAATVLIMAGVLGALVTLWGILGSRGLSWSWPAALCTLLVLTLACVWRASLSWVAVFNGQSPGAFWAALVTLMLVVSASLLWMLVKDRKATG